MNRADTADDNADAARLRWRCRRGMRELDVLLERWLTQCWAGAGPVDRRRFEKLLSCEDDALWNWCSGRMVPDDPDLAAIVDQVTGLGHQYPDG